MRRWLPLLVLTLVALAYLPSLPGGWVWDDWYQVARNPGLAHPLTLLTSDVWSPTGQARSDLFRPLFMLSFVPGQALAPGPGVERLFSLGLHLVAVVLIAWIGRALGVPRTSAWFSGAVFGLHPAASEAVAWISARCDLAPAVLYLLAWGLWVRERPLAASAVLAVCPFFKESWLVLPVVVLVWMAGARRWRPWPLLVTCLGTAAYLGARHAVGVPMPASATSVPLLASLGGLAARGAALLVVPNAPDAFPQLASAPTLGVLAAGAGLAVIVGAWGRPWLAGLAGAALTLGPSFMAAAHTGLAADRYYYAVLGPLAVALAWGLRGRTPARWAWALPVGLGLLTAARAGAWTTDQRLFSASLAAAPSNPYAAFHLGYDLHTRAGDCAAAVPLYELGLTADDRAGTNLLACLIDLGRAEEAASRGAQLAEAHPERAGLARNTAQAFAVLGELAEAEAWCRRAIALAPERCDLQVMLGNLLGQQGQLDQAEEAFRAALGAGDDCAPQARQGLAAVAAHRTP